MNDKKSQQPCKQSYVDQDYFSALDIGSNSFHFVLARQLGEHIQIVHSEKYRVQLAQGLNKDDWLDDAAMSRGLATLTNLATSTSHLKQKNFRAVATFTLRQAKNSAKFLTAAAKIFPFDIEIISGHEEARLIYQGVAHHTQSEQQMLVIDIGGGSTECIIGKGGNIKALASLTMGCVSYSQQFFANGDISHQGFNQAIKAAKHEIDSIIKRFRHASWQNSLGTSGTIKSIYKITNAEQVITKDITLESLYLLKEQLLQCQHCDQLTLKALKESRRQVICAGVAILIALMERLEIKSLGFCQYALREGVLFEQIENLQQNNTQLRTLANMQLRFNIDINQAEMVKKLAIDWFEQVKEAWSLNKTTYKALLSATLKLHELGLDINASGYHKHGQYIIEHADLAGFNQEQQYALAWLVGNQRKKITPLIEQHWHLLSPDKLKKLCILVRLSCLICQQRHDTSTNKIAIQASSSKINLVLSTKWLLSRPIIDTELFYEKTHIDSLGIELTINA